MLDGRCSADEGEGVLAGLVVFEVHRGDRACAVEGNDLAVQRDEGFVEVSICILTVDLPDAVAYLAAALAIYDALEPSL